MGAFGFELHRILRRPKPWQLPHPAKGKTRTLMKANISVPLFRYWLFFRRGQCPKPEAQIPAPETLNGFLRSSQGCTQSRCLTWHFSLRGQFLVWDAGYMERGMYWLAVKGLKVCYYNKVNPITYYIPILRYLKP